MLSGNRNFEARIHPEVKANYLASPPLVVAYALAGRMDIDLETRADRHGPRRQRRLPRATSGRRSRRSQDAIARTVRSEMFTHTYGDVFTGDEHWRALPVPEGDLFAWEPDSTYVRQPPYFEGMPASRRTVDDIRGARCLVCVGDSITTDHISPAGSIKLDEPGRRSTCSSTASSGRTSTRTAHAAATTRCMVRGTFANVRLRNLLAPRHRGHLDRPPARRRGDDDLRRVRAVPAPRARR